MTEGRRRDEWDRWSLYLSIFWNANFKARRSPASFNPFSPSFGKIGGDGLPITRASISMLKSLVPRSGRKGRRR
jgi:hypothetical protein